MKRVTVKRRYDRAGRQAEAARTRARVLQAAYRLFTQRGYAPTTVAQIAREAGVALDTIYASIGRKQELFRALVEASISGTGQAVPAEERDYVRAIRSEADPGRKLVLYARAVRRIHQRLAPLIRVLKDAAPADEDLAAVWKSIASRRAANMRLFAANLAATGGLRPGVGVKETADVLWATNAPEFYLLLVNERGWTPGRFESWIARAWIRLLLRPQGPWQEKSERESKRRLAR